MPHKGCLKKAALPCLAFVIFLFATPGLKRIREAFDAGPNPRVSKFPNLSNLDLSENDDKYLVVPNGVCDRSHTFLVYVLARANGFERRELIRRTWGNTSMYNDGGCITHGFNVRVIFAMGLSPNTTSVNRTRLSHDVAQYGDIWIGRFEDTYENVVLKGVGMLSWINDTCDGDRVDFVVKTDEDVFPNLFALLRRMWAMVSTRKQSRWPHFFCLKQKNAKVIREARSKYAVSYEEFNEEYYPTYCLGALYAISRQAVSLIIEGINRTGTFRMEDVYLTGIAPRADRTDLSLRYAEMLYRETPTWSKSYKKSFSAYHRLKFIHKLPMNMYERVVLWLIAQYCEHWIFVQMQYTTLVQQFTLMFDFNGKLNGMWATLATLIFAAINSQ